MPADTGYGCKMVDGVVHVYTKATNMDKCVFVSQGVMFFSSGIFQADLKGVVLVCLEGNSAALHHLIFTNVNYLTGLLCFGRVSPQPVVFCDILFIQKICHEMKCMCN